jgi:hypothetical protein
MLILSKMQKLRVAMISTTTILALSCLFILRAQTQEPSLVLSLSTSRASWSSGEQVPVTITLSNNGSATAWIPFIAPQCPRGYFTLSVTQSSTDIFFLIPTERAVGPTATSQPLPPNQSVTCTATLNTGGFGFYEATPSNPDVYASGQMSVNGVFSVLEKNKPTDGNPNLFLGSVSSTPISIQLISNQTGDVNGDGVINCTDLDIVKAAFGKSAGQPGWDARADVNHDGVINVLDLAFVSQRLSTGTHCQ